ncbi:MAG: DUF3073 domain-containing protein [Pseudonocardiales bacterium]|nr:DUF3073 domain-containing protein [Pseudonocardiales bacterium]
MGRGRAKAKQTRVARELKYHSPATDLEALQRELSGGNAGSPTVGNGHGDGSHGEEDRVEETYPDEDEAYHRR